MMGLIFNDAADDQTAAMSSAAVGWTWHYRFAKAKWIAYGIMGSVGSACATALIDYAIFKFTDYSGILGWMLG
jgi:hypothetical protein